MVSGKVGGFNDRRFGSFPDGCKGCGGRQKGIEDAMVKYRWLENVEGIVDESDVSNEEVGEESELDAVNSYLAMGP